MYGDIVFEKIQLSQSKLFCNFEWNTESNTQNTWSEMQSLTCDLFVFVFHKDFKEIFIQQFRALDHSHMWPINGRSDNGKTGRIKMQMSRNKCLIWIATTKTKKKQKKRFCRNRKFYAYAFDPYTATPNLKFWLFKIKTYYIWLRSVNACRHHRRTIWSKVKSLTRRGTMHATIKFFAIFFFLLLLFATETLQRLYAGNRNYTTCIAFTCSSCINTKKNSILCAVARPTMTTVFNHYSVNDTANFIPSQANLKQINAFTIHTQWPKR